jgi:integrase
LDDVHKIYSADLSEFPNLDVQRDIFVFQCNIGCRIGDLLRLKKRDVINGAVEYIPTKTIKENARTVVVPLNKVAREIVDKYADYPGDQLLPFESSERFNDNIKIILEKAGVTYLVTELDSLTRTEKKVPINEVASSHMARRTFIGNIYKLVKDPNLVSALTGHVEGSRAFTRYRTIDIDMKKDLVKILEGAK